MEVYTYMITNYVERLLRVYMEFNTALFRRLT